MMNTGVKLLAQTDDIATVGGWGVVFGGKDLYGETFSADTDYMLDLVPRKPVLYDHTLGEVKHFLGAVVKIEQQDGGLWVEAELNRHAEYVEHVLALVEKGALGWSSGSVGHLVRMDGSNIKAWPVVEMSLTPTPAEYRTLGVEVIKTLIESDSSFEALMPEAGAATPAASADDAEIAVPDDAQSGENTIMATEANLQETKSDALDMAALLADIKAIKAALENEPPVNAVQSGAPAHLKTGRGDNEIKAWCHYLRTGDESAVGRKAYNDTDMNIGTAADGGYTVPTGLYNQIVAKMDETILHPKLGVQRIPGKGLTVRAPIDNEPDITFATVTEGGNVLRDAPALTYKDFTLVKKAKYIELTWELLRDEDANLMGFLSNWVGRGMAATHNSALVTEALASGTAGLTLDAAAAIGAAEIPELVGKLMPSYQGGAQWLMHPTTKAYLQGLSGNQFYFAPREQGYAADPTMWGYPANATEYMTALGASVKSLVFGNFNFMGMRQGTELNMLRDPYTSAGTGGVKLWFWFDLVYGVMQAEAIQYATHPSA